MPETLAELIRAQVRLLRTLLGTIADLDHALGAGLLGHAKAGLLASMPRIGEVNLAQLVAEVGPILDRVDTAEQAIAECGAAPVTRASGKTRTVGFRWAANRRARTALHAFADNSRHASPWALASMPTPADAASTTPTPSGSWPAPGFGSCGPAGTPTPPTTPPSMAVNSASPPELDSGNSSGGSPITSGESCSATNRPATTANPRRLDRQRRPPSSGSRQC
jgi:hypothetical protein